MKIFKEKQFQRSSPRTILDSFKSQQNGAGFTLIELLVVVASIALISSIAVVSALSIRESGKDTRISVNMDSLRKTAATYWVIGGNYSGFCSDAQTLSLAADIGSMGGQNYNCQVQTTNPVGDSYCVEAQLNSGEWLCIDNAGTFQQYEEDPACDEAQSNKSCIPN